MSKIALSGNASGTGTFTFAAPGTNTDRTLTLPDATGTVATTADVSAVQSMTLLGTLDTTSGTSVTLSGLTLTSYKMLNILVNDVGMGFGDLRLNSASGPPISNTVSSPNLLIFSCVIYLSSGLYVSSGRNLASGITGASSGAVYVGRSGITTSSTSVTVGATDTFLSGSILIYGVK
jgi:hypothetical protein